MGSGHPLDSERIEDILVEHEVIQLTEFPTGNSGWWVAVALCACGYTSPPEKRAAHLAQVLCKAASDGLRMRSAFPTLECSCGHPETTNPDDDPDRVIIHLKNRPCYHYLPLGADD